MIRDSPLGLTVAALCLGAWQRCWQLLQRATVWARSIRHSDTRNERDQRLDTRCAKWLFSETNRYTDRQGRQILTDGGTASRWSAGRVTRILLAAIGLGLVSLTILVLFRPTVLPLNLVPVSRLSDSIRDNLLQALGVTALFGGVLIYLGRHVMGIGRSSTSAQDTNPLPYPPESIRTSPADQVGTAFDDRLAAIDSTGRENEVDRFKTALRDRVIDLQTLYEGYDEQTATERVEAGQWTDDPRAAAFLGGSAVEGPSWRTELWDWLRPMPRTERRIRHTVDALEAYATTHAQTGVSEEHQ